MQFVGSFQDFEWERLWTMKAEPKCKMFGWLILPNKLWTADRILKYGGQTNPVCQLCHTQPVSAPHASAMFLLPDNLEPIREMEWFGLPDSS
jgi:hypothetical protein